MLKYRNVRDGRIAARHVPDKWLEASAGWERIEDELELTEPGQVFETGEAFLASLDEDDERTTDGE